MPGNDAPCFKTAGEVRQYLHQLGIATGWVHPTATLWAPDKPVFIVHLPRVTRVTPREALGVARYTGTDASRFQRVRRIAPSIGIEFDVEEREAPKPAAPWWRQI